MLSRFRILAMLNICSSGWLGMWSLCGCLLRDFSAHKIGFLCKEKWISLLPALDFIRWYCRQSNKLLSNKKWDGITFEMLAFFSGYIQCENVFCIYGRWFFQRQDRKRWLTWRLHRWHQLSATGYAFCSSVMFNVIWDYLCNTAVGTSGVSENLHLFFAFLQHFCWKIRLTLRLHRFSFIYLCRCLLRDSILNVLLQNYFCTRVEKDFHITSVGNSGWLNVSTEWH